MPTASLCSFLSPRLAPVIPSALSSPIVLSWLLQVSPKHIPMQANTTMLPTNRQDKLHTSPLQHMDVYLDNIVGLVQGHPDDLVELPWAILHSIDAIFWPLQESNGPQQEETASLKKLVIDAWSLDSTKRWQAT